MSESDPIVLGAQQEAVFAHIQALYGDRPEFGAATGPLRNLIAFIAKNGARLLANPKLLSVAVSTLSLVFPAAAPILAELAPILADLGPVIALLTTTTTTTPATNPTATVIPSPAVGSNLP